MINPENEYPFDVYQELSQDWHQIWSQLITDNQQALIAFMDHQKDEKKTYPIDGNLIDENLNTTLPPTPTRAITLFDPEIMGGVLAQAMEKLSEHPEKMIDLQKQHLRDVMTVVDEVRKQLRGEEHHEIILADPRDKRFSNEIWHTNPAFFFIQQIYLLNSKLLRDTLSHIRGLDKKTTHKLKFYTQHLIDAFAPTNFPLTNPDVIRETFETQGENLRQGFRNFLRDTAHGTFQMKTMDKDAFTLGKDIATTKGNIVFRNDLLELIHYAPTTKTVHEKPLLIVPPWINKFYIFDLKPENSFVKWLVDQGFTLFMISWVNPDQRHAQKTLTDYVLGGVKTALDFICQETKHPTINAIGYCTGGVLLNLLLAYLKTKGKKSIDCATLITTPFNFKEAGDLLVFVCEQQLEQLEKHVSRKGYLEGNAMVQSFNLLRANDLIWSFYVTNYLMGQEPIPFDMLYWNGDATRMPAKMHTDFLRAMYLENRLMKPGGISIDGVPIDLSHIDVPLFIMAAIEDHIAPWHSVYPLATTTQGKNKFILSGSGHVAGVFNHPNKHKYYFMEGEHLTKNANKWFNKAHKVEGSWWPTWQNWVIPFSGNRVQSLNRRPNRDLGKAPGTYVKTSGLQ